jgi:hypothetical protein
MADDIEINFRQDAGGVHLKTTCKIATTSALLQPRWRPNEAHAATRFESQEECSE